MEEGLTKYATWSECSSGRCALLKHFFYLGGGGDAFFSFDLHRG